MADSIILRVYSYFYPKQMRNLWKGDSNFCNHDWKSSRNPRECWETRKLAYLLIIFKNKIFSLMTLENAIDSVSKLLSSLAHSYRKKVLAEY